MPAAASALDQAIEFLQTVVKPRAQDIDQDAGALREVLAEMGARELMALKRPTAFGGPELDEPNFRRFQEEMARTSGTLAFCQTQHQSAVAMLSRSDNNALKAAYLPYMADGKKQVGIGFSQLRRPGPPIMRAEHADDGFVLNGVVPWVTGWSFFGEFLVGATLPDGKALFAVVPLTGQPGLIVSAPMKLAAMETAMTVSVEFEGFPVPQHQVAFIREAGWIANSDMINIALQGHFAIGCALGGLDVLEAAHERRKEPFLATTLLALRNELAACRAETAQAQSLAGEETTEDRLRVRAWAVDLAFRCAQAAIVCSSGAANSLLHPAQRIYREALVYSVSAQTTSIMAATLSRLTRPEPLDLEQNGVGAGVPRT
ncbi:MAG: acyl-CoA dehydrogenase family protein [Fimbriimonadaceae bacterium]